MPIGSLLAGAGIAGVAIGLGAQGFMSDVITGFFIIMEQQMDVGDYIKLANLTIEGTVVSVGIRTLQLKARMVLSISSRIETSPRSAISLVQICKYF